MENVSFASPVPENLRQDNSNSMIVGDKIEIEEQGQADSENLRQQLEAPPSLNLSHNEEIARDRPTGPSFSFENITISEENQETASEETESPGLDFWSFKLSPSLSGENHAGAISENVTTPEEARQENQEELTEAEMIRMLRECLDTMRQTSSAKRKITT